MGFKEGIKVALQFVPPLLFVTASLPGGSYRVLADAQGRPVGVVGRDLQGRPISYFAQAWNYDPFGVNRLLQATPPGIFQDLPRVANLLVTSDGPVPSVPIDGVMRCVEGASSTTPLDLAQLRALLQQQNQVVWKQFDKLVRQYRFKDKPDHATWLLEFRDTTLMIAAQVLDPTALAGWITNLEPTSDHELSGPNLERFHKNWVISDENFRRLQCDTALQEAIRACFEEFLDIVPKRLTTIPTIPWLNDPVMLHSTPVGGSPLYTYLTITNESDNRALMDQFYKAVQAALYRFPGREQEALDHLIELMQDFHAATDSPPIGPADMDILLSVFPLGRPVGDDWEKRSTTLQQRLHKRAKGILSLPSDSPHYQDPRRALLLSSQPHGDLYGELLVAYDERGPQGYAQWLERHPHNQATLARMNELGVDAEAWQNYDAVSYVDLAVTAEMEASEEFLPLFFSQVAQALKGFYPFLHRPDRLYEKMRDTLPDGSQLSHWDQALGVGNFSVLLSLIQQQKDLEGLRRMVQAALDFTAKRDNLRGAPPQVLFFHLRQAQRSLRGDVSSHEGISGLLQIRCCRKDPVKDIHIGRDGGSCIGIYLPDEEEELSNGVYLPHLFADMGTKFLELILGRQRVGFALLFASESDKAIPYVAINSTELGQTFSNAPKQLLVNITKAVCDYVCQMSQATRFQGACLSTHDYNTAWNHRPGQGIQAPSSVLRKLSRLSRWPGSVYTDLFGATGDQVADQDQFNVIVPSTSSSAALDPERYLQSNRPTLPGTLGATLSASERMEWMLRSTLAWHLLKDRSVDRAIAERFAVFLRGLPAARRKELCERLVMLPHNDLLAELDSLLQPK